MPDYKNPGAYIEEQNDFPFSITSVETAIPVFIGHTEKARREENNDLRNIPTLITSIPEYEQLFGKAKKEADSITLTIGPGGEINATIDQHRVSAYLLYYSVQMFFLNGGGPCYIVSIGGYSYKGKINFSKLKIGLKAIESTAHITLIVFPDSINIKPVKDFYQIHKLALDQCYRLRDRFLVMDLLPGPGNTGKNIEHFREEADLGDNDRRKYGAVYYPRIYCSLDFRVNENKVNMVQVSESSTEGIILSALRKNNSILYAKAITAIRELEMLLPVSAAIAGIYALTDKNQGVWKAPANVNILKANRPEMMINDLEQQRLNPDPVNGKYINVIRSFPDYGSAVVWGARTLAGDDNEWRYISVRRFVNMLEESIRKSIEQFVFDPNSTNTWIKIQSMIEIYLTNLWRNGALAGSTADHAFFVKVGFGQTMTEADIINGIMIIEIGLAIIRPAEFVITCIQQKMLSET